MVNAGGVVHARFDSTTSDLVHGQTETFAASGPLAGAHFWDVDEPYLYDVYSILSVGGKVGHREVGHRGLTTAKS